MRYRVLVAIASAVMLVPGLVAAQDEETWYFAWKPETGEVVAYTAAGVVNVLLHDILAYRLLRLDNQSALLLVGRDGLFVLYKLTPDGVQRIKGQFDESLIPEHQYQIGNFIIPAVRLPYVLMTSNSQLIPELLLVNTDEGIVQHLDTRMLHTTSMCDIGVYGHTLDRCVRFSADGTRLRYLANPATETNGEIWVLRERILATGEERVIYTFSDPAPDTTSDRTYCEPDRYGERWICKTGIDYERGQFTEFWMLHSNGDRESIKVVNNLPDWQWHIFFADDNLVTVENLCESNCHIEVQSPDDTSLVFHLPSDYSLRTLPINDVTLIDEERMLIFTGDERFILSLDGILTELGGVICCHYGPSMTEAEDGRWLIVHQEYEIFRVWDLLNQEVVIEVDPTHASWFISYRKDGFLIRGSSDTPERFIYQNLAYIYATGTLTELPASTNGVFFDVLSDDHFLYEQKTKHGDMAKGIYRYSLHDNDFGLLVLGGEQIPQFEQ